MKSILIVLACFLFVLSVPCRLDEAPIDPVKGRALMEKFKNGETLTPEEQLIWTVSAGDPRARFGKEARCSHETCDSSQYDRLERVGAHRGHDYAV